MWIFTQERFQGQMRRAALIKWLRVCVCWCVCVCVSVCAHVDKVSQEGISRLLGSQSRHFSVHQSFSYGRTTFLSVCVRLVSSRPITCVHESLHTTRRTSTDTATHTYARLFCGWLFCDGQKALFSCGSSLCFLNTILIFPLKSQRNDIGLVCG